MRYKELKSETLDISQKMLTTTLKYLEEYNFIQRKAYAEIPPRVEYSLTETGRSFVPVLEQMLNWAQEHYEEVKGIKRIK